MPLCVYVSHVDAHINDAERAPIVANGKERWLVLRKLVRKALYKCLHGTGVAGKDEVRPNHMVRVSRAH